MELLTAIGDEQEERDIPTAAGQVQQKVQAEVVTPMDILHHEEHGLPCRLLHQKMRHGSEEPSLLLFRINRWWDGERCQIREKQCQVRQQSSERRDERVQCVGKGCRGISRKIWPEEVKERSIRERTIRMET